ncbi:MAG: preprotein translocase subunit SecG [Pirellulaceae bacterium]
MFPLAFSSFHYLFIIPLCILSVFLSLVILVQRGRGGGLTGALGGMGGQSAFGTKAGDLFTRITIVVAAIWIVLSMATVKVLNTPVVAPPPGPAKAGTAGGKGATTTDIPIGKADKDQADKGAPATPATKSPAAKTPPLKPTPPAGNPPAGNPPAGNAAEPSAD